MSNCNGFVTTLRLEEIKRRVIRLEWKMKGYLYKPPVQIAASRIIVA